MRGKPGLTLTPCVTGCLVRPILKPKYFETSHTYNIEAGRCAESKALTSGCEEEEEEDRAEESRR